jgi:hypothetical protein
VQNRSTKPVHRPPSAPMWETIVEFGNAQNFVNGVTALLAFTDYGTEYTDLAVVLRNDATSPNAVDLVVDVSHGGILPNSEMTITKSCPVGDERRADIGRPNPNTYLRVQANNAGATCTGAWALIGLRR